MKTAHRHENVYTLNFDPGEEVVSGLIRFAKEENIKAGHLTGLGAASKVVLAYYNLKTKKYENKEFIEDVEIVSLIGNIAVKGDGEKVIHVHGVFGRRDFSVFGGHVVSLIVSGAGEVHFTAFPGSVNRVYSEDTGLNLML